MMNGTCSTHGRDMKYMKLFNKLASGEETR